MELFSAAKHWNFRVQLVPIVNCDLAVSGHKYGYQKSTFGQFSCGRHHYRCGTLQPALQHLRR
ncbi:hypothetical protein D3C85_1394710 [compost metagenome]